MTKNDFKKKQRLQEKLEYLKDIASDFCYLIATCKYAEYNINREKELKNIKKKIDKVKQQLSQFN